jgi:hypothetical protein
MLRRASELLATTALLTALGMACAQAQLVVDVDWTEGDVPPPPAFSFQQLIPFEVNRQTNLQYGVDPASLSITPTGIVRYVVVAQSSGARNVLYEGFRCSTAQVRTYARQSSDGVWISVANSTWRGTADPLPSRHAFFLARSALCAGAAPAQTTADIVRSLRGTNRER